MWIRFLYKEPVKFCLIMKCFLCCFIFLCAGFDFVSFKYGRFVACFSFSRRSLCSVWSGGDPILPRNTQASGHCKRHGWWCTNRYDTVWMLLLIQQALSDVDTFILWPSHGEGGKGGRVPLLIAKIAENREKERTRGKESEKEKIGKKRGKSGRFLYFAPPDRACYSPAFILYYN